VKELLLRQLQRMRGLASGRTIHGLLATGTGSLAALMAFLFGAPPTAVVLAWSCVTALVFGALLWRSDSLAAVERELTTLRDWRNRGLISIDGYAEHSAARLRGYRRRWYGNDAGPDGPTA
jgi:hypothetical protein